LPVLELIIFAGLAAVVLYQLYAVLGRRVGRQPEDAAKVEAKAAPPRSSDQPQTAPDDGVSLTGLAAVKAIDPSFDVGHFLSGAKQAYEMTVKAFAAADRPTLRNLLAPQVMASFDTAIAEREEQGITETVEFLHPPRADLEKADVGRGPGRGPGPRVRALPGRVPQPLQRPRGRGGGRPPHGRTLDLRT
jgi:predicted lipid-binding transport protein (Tim44 family)